MKLTTEERRALGRALIDHRNSRNFTQEDLEERAGVALRTIQRAESGDGISPVNLAAVAKALAMTPDALIATLQWFGIRVDRAAATPGEMVGLGDGLKLAPSALIRGYLELASRAGQPGVSPIVQGMMASARTGTGRAVGAAIGRTEALAKTGTAPCSHSPRASGDGYAVVVYPADRPRVVLLVQAHGRTGAETAEVAGRLLTHALGVR